jgi:2-polyprenyl-6-hydroxyphenyl methylase/3-demethylubiquinone-9 3-methyltransferase
MAHSPTPVAGSPTGALDEIRRGERFAFGANWRQFLEGLTPARIAEAVASMRELVGVESLRGKSFLDIGSGSGLFSLAARRLEARVHSFDFDPQSVACTESLRAQFHPADPEWRIETGSVLDPAFVASVGRHDVVYSWGVLHHTGAMWQAVGNACTAVRPGGLLVIALYNRQPLLTPFWVGVKRLYQVLPRMLQPVLVFPFFLLFALLGLLADLVALRSPLKRWRGQQRRGMRMYWDAVDWVGGWPFEVASPAEVVEFCRPRGFRLERIRTVGGRHGCNEFVFRLAGPADGPAPAVVTLARLGSTP